ncbi:porin OmpC [Erwinia amylovora]|uniref:Outer membrane protein (Porin) n=3 Tax=Erwinia amylovora TaxID=552 RepID=A0A831EQD0_ERWAM|nr:porin OmpC [Erwinia amylovora]CDK14887.1 Outer membrane protein precursor (Porin) [Erwinia amylovora LA635]CDK18255.1 Outer membrane protein precursor (Porin) [Erwinia amylovora LA636]CDK21624.1 Outer membrane protein precursor (Porin) [Erwinia amylovora LA637]ATZ11212.1 porin OmpC [Erwinia amylovora]EKV54072.1 Outer membrane protein precursor (Porin) [Erwinia amylovora ACW56400]
MMKRNILAVLIPALLAAGAANAAEIYNKDGNKLDLYGKVDARHQFSDNSGEDGDESYVRFGFKGETQISDRLTGYGQWEYNVQANVAEAEGTSGSKTRVGFAGLKFADYGAFDYGRNYGVGYDPLAWTDILPVFGGDSGYSDNGMVGRSNGLATYRNSNFFGLVDGLDFALQYQGKNEESDNGRKIEKANGDGWGSSVTYTTPVGVAVSAAYTRSDRTNAQQNAYFANGSKTAETWSTAVKYDAKSVYLAAMYGETRNNTFISGNFDGVDRSGMVNKEQKFEAVAQYQFDFGLRPSLAYVQSVGKKIENVGKQDLYKYIDVATYYYFNKNMSTYVDYKINLLDENEFTRNAGISTDNTVGVGLVYQF